MKETIEAKNIFQNRAGCKLAECSGVKQVSATSRRLLANGSTVFDKTPTATGNKKT